MVTRGIASVHGGGRPVRVVSVPSGSGGGCGGCCCLPGCCCKSWCSCIHLRFFKTPAGLLKLAEVLLAGFCQTLLVEHGLPYANTLGASFHGLLTTTSACSMTTLLLLICYVFSEQSYNLIKQSLFEVLFNAFAAFSYASATSYFTFAMKTYLQVLHFHIYPALNVASNLGFVLAIIHLCDAIIAYRFYRGYR